MVGDVGHRRLKPGHPAAPSSLILPTFSLSLFLSVSLVATGTSCSPRFLQQADAAAGRRRGLKTAAGRAEIARTVLRLKAESAAGATLAESSQGDRLLRDANQSGADAPVADGAETGVGGGSSPDKIELDAEGDGGANTAPSVDAGGTASAAARPAAEKDRKALAEKAVQLFGLFDGESRAAVYGGAGFLAGRTLLSPASRAAAGKARHVPQETGSLGLRRLR